VTSSLITACAYIIKSPPALSRRPLLLIIAANALLASSALNQSQFSSVRGGQRRGMTSETHTELAQSSRNAIIETGFSSRYFDQHFKFQEAFNKPGDIRVVWKLSINGYETFVNDAIGYYTAENQKKVFLHSVKNTLGQTRDINKTISRRRAQNSMRACLGRYAGETVVLMRLIPSEPTLLYLTAHSVTRRTRNTEDNEPEINARPQPGTNNRRVDQPEREDTKKRPPVRIGYVNLETGKCTLGQAITAP
jgi:hypothetical protein